MISVIDWYIMAGRSVPPGQSLIVTAAVWRIFVENMEYELIRSARKTIAIEITPEGKVVVRAPRRCARRVIEELLREKEGWILDHLQKIRLRREEQQARRDNQPKWQESDYARARSLAKAVFQQKAELYAHLMQVDYGRITVRDQKTRWGSCSAKGNLNFNWRLILAPEDVLDYVVIHELAHRREMNHSDRFWRIVESVMPDYRERRQWLRDHGDQLMSW